MATKARSSRSVGTSVKQRALADLARSGLTEADARAMQIKPLEIGDVAELTEKWAVPAYEIPYFELDGKQNCFSRIRFLAPVRPFGSRKDLRYWQPAGSRPRAYLPPFTDWCAVAADTDVEVYLTEGEKKAAAATRAGLPTIGLGGVWSWRSRPRRERLLPDLEAFDLRDRRLVLVFDADPDPKPEVAAALDALARELTSRGATVFTVTLPAAPGQKVGLDDYLVAEGVDAFNRLDRKPIGIGAALALFNEEVAYLEDTGAVYVPATGQLFTNRQQFTGVAYAHRTVPTFDARGNRRDLNVADEWLRWPCRRTYKRLTYAPGEDRVLADGSYNTWSGWGCQPVAGDVTPFFELLDYLLADIQPEHRRWFLQWLAYPLQNPGTKLYTAVVIWSQLQGVGKTLLGQTIGRIYGSNYTVVTPTQLHSAFNDWAQGRQFILGEEVTGTDKRQDADLLKHLITSDTITVNKKYKPLYELPHLANYLFTSNQPDAFLLDAADRRYFIHEVTKPPPPMEFFNAYDAWLRHPEGAAALFYYLLNDVDCRGFNPRAMAPVTDAKRDMIDLSGGEADRLARELLLTPDEYLHLAGRPFERDLFTTTELVTILGVNQTVSAITLNRALRRAGFRQLPMTKTSAGGRRLWAVRNVDRWLAASHAERAAEYAQLKDKKY